MKKINKITIDLTKDSDEIWAQIDEASEALKKTSKKSLWQRIKSWF